MTMIAICDGCGEQHRAACYNGHWSKPHDWFERTPLDEHGNQQRNIMACSRRCIDRAEDNRAAEVTGHKPMTVVLPI
jgi:hypothetical protein